jgi:phosphoglycerate dehydrogenase-like enzyme
MVAALKSPKLAWVQSGGAGYENPVFAAIVRKGATLTTQHVQSVGIAEHVLWGVLDHWQRGPERRANQAERRWERLPFREIAGSHWLIVGFGAIGQDTARLARGFGARVTGARRTPGEHPLADAVTANWREALPGADVVVFSLPLSSATARMADADAFAAFKPGSVFVNVGRGGLVDEPALLSALDRGAPEHAVLDVFDVEPLPLESPFWDHPRVTVTSHLAALGSGLQGRSDRVFLNNLRRWAAGEPLVDAVSAEQVLAGA